MRLPCSEFAQLLYIDTKSNGLDLVVTHHLNLGKGSSLKTSLAGTFSKTKLDGDVKTSEALADKVDTYFDETSRIYLENSVPNTKLNLSFAYKINKFNAFLRGVYFGQVHRFLHVFHIMISE